MAFLRCYMCKNTCGIIATVEGKTVRVAPNKNHPQPGICGRGAAGGRTFIGFHDISYQPSSSFPFSGSPRLG